MSFSATQYDVVIIGAGIHGLCCAHTFLQIDPTLNILIVDDKKSIGGVWADEQIYPTLRANNLQGFYEFSDFPITQADVGVEERGVLTGESFNAYVKKYADQFGLTQLVRLNTKVTRAIQQKDHREKSWVLQFNSNITPGQITCSKLVVATGHASQPLVPPLLAESRSSKFPIIHTETLGSQGLEISQDSSVKHVTVIGGSKSAHDAVYMFHKAGKQVTWFMRQSGRGGMPMAKSHLRLNGSSIWLENMLMSRQLSWFGACPWSDGDGFSWIRALLHRTSIGRWLTRTFFSRFGLLVAEQSGILASQKTLSLAPAASLQWYGTQASSLTFEDDFYDMIEDEQIEIVKGEMIRLHAEGLTIKESGEDLLKTIFTDAIICATGYRYEPSFSIEPPENRLGWGIPIPSNQDEVLPASDLKADIDLLQRFPELMDAPKSLERQPGHTPWRLWRFIAPPSQVVSDHRSLAFLCNMTAYQTTIKIELSSLWTYAYLFDRLDVKPESEEKVMYEAAMWSRFGFWHRPMGMQGKLADMLMDSFPYYDLLLRDLGLRSWRRGNIFAELFTSCYTLQDYKGLVQEWTSAQTLKRGTEDRKSV